MLDGPKLLREARKAAGLTQAQLAERLGVGQPEIARLERRGANPRLRTLQSAIQATGHGLTASLRPDQGGAVDETMIAANLRLEPGERLRHFEAAYRNVSELARKARRVDGP